MKSQHEAQADEFQNGPYTTRSQRQLTFTSPATSLNDSFVRILARRRWIPDALAVSWVVIAGVLSLTPALLHGAFFGPYDILSKSGLTLHQNVAIHNPQTADQVALFIPWTNQVWLQVHHGHLPLWNPYSGLGMPLAFNFESAPLSIPALVGYLVPMQYAYTVGVVVTVTLAGTGAYVLGRVLSLGVIASAFAGTTFALSGAMFGNLGWSAGTAGSLAGWLFAFAILVIRGRHRLGCIGLFALALAFLLYSGHPETAVMIIVGLGVFLLVFVGYERLKADPHKSVLSPTIDLGCATILGLLLAAPLFLPGLQAVNGSIRNLSSPSTQLGVNVDLLTWHNMSHLIFQSFDGSPVLGSTYFGTITYQATAAYVGVVALVLALLALFVQRRRKEVVAFAVLVLAMVLLAFENPAVSLIPSVPLLRNVALWRALLPMDLALAILAGFGVDLLIRSPDRRKVGRVGLVGFLAVGVVLLALWIFGRGHLPSGTAHIRSESFVWPLVGTLIGILAFAFLAFSDRRAHAEPGQRGTTWRNSRHVVALVLLLSESAFLISVAGPIYSSTSQAPGPTKTVSELQHMVGSGTIGFSQPSCSYAYTGLGVLPNYNVALDLREMAVYDPIIPKSYFQSWQSVTGSSAGIPLFDLFCPGVPSSSVARRFGIEYVLSPGTARAPAGASFVRSVGNENLYRIPGASPAVLVPVGARGTSPPDGAAGKPVSVSYPNPSTWTLTTTTTTAQVLRLHLTAVPGWRATIDGKPLSLTDYSGMMLQARVPPGRHTIVVTYWPPSFSLGLLLAALAIVGWILVMVLAVFRKRTRNITPNYTERHEVNPKTLV